MPAEPVGGHCRPPPHASFRHGRQRCLRPYGGSSARPRDGGYLTVPKGPRSQGAWSTPTPHPPPLPPAHMPAGSPRQPACSAAGTNSGSKRAAPPLGRMPAIPQPRIAGCGELAGGIQGSAGPWPPASRPAGRPPPPTLPGGAQNRGARAEGGGPDGDGRARAARPGLHPP